MRTDISQTIYFILCYFMFLIMFHYLGVRAFQQTTDKTCEESGFGMTISEAVLGRIILNESKF